MKSVYIKKDGIVNVVDEAQFNSIYKPAGWVIDKAAESTSAEKIIKELKTQTKIKNYTNMKKDSKKAFDDGLLKKE